MSESPTKKMKMFSPSKEQEHVNEETPYIVHTRSDDAAELPIRERPHELNIHIARIFKLEEKGMAVRDCPHWEIDMVEWKYNPDAITGFVDSEGFYQCSEQSQCWCTTKITYIYTLSHKEISGVCMEIGSSCMKHFDHKKIREEALTIRKKHTLRKKGLKCQNCFKLLDNFRLKAQRDEGYCNDICAGRKCWYRNCQNGLSLKKWSGCTPPPPRITKENFTDARYKDMYEHRFCSRDCFEGEELKIREKECKSCNKLFIPNPSLIDECFGCKQKKKKKHAEPAMRRLSHLKEDNGQRNVGVVTRQNNR